MQLATLREGGRDGTLVVVSADRQSFAPASVPTLQAALDDWAEVEADLRRECAQLDAGGTGEVLDPAMLAAPLPRAYQWAEASTYTVHMERLRNARGLDLPPDHGREPAAYNSGSDAFLAGLDPVRLGDVDWGLDVETTIAVITDDVPMGTSVAEAASHIKLVVLVNDLTLRNVLPREYARGVGFFQAKPLRTMAPLAVTPEGLGACWDGSLLHSTVSCWINDEQLGALDSAADAAFDFPAILAHLSLTRPLAAGSTIGSGTVANRRADRGFGAIAEKRAVELAKHGRMDTSLLEPGDRFRIEAFDAAGQSLFGAIDQLVVPADD